MRRSLKPVKAKVEASPPVARRSHSRCRCAAVTEPSAPVNSHAYCLILVDRIRATPQACCRSGRGHPERLA
jgi:hypothetical protein